MSDVSIQGMMTALANLKGIPVQKVVRNAARDYVQGTYNATPLAKVSKSEYYVAINGKRKWYIHETMLKGKKPKNVEGKTALYKVRIRKGWSKSTWIGAFRALGLSPKFGSKRLPQAVEHKSYAIQRTAGLNPAVTISDEFQINDFGRTTTQPQHERIGGEGFKLAILRITKELTKMLKEAWR